MNIMTHEPTSPPFRGWLHMFIFYTLRAIFSIRIVITPIVVLIQMSRVHVLLRFPFLVVGYVISVIIRTIPHLLRFIKHLVVASWNWAVLLTIVISLLAVYIPAAITDFMYCRIEDTWNSTTFCNSTMMIRFLSLPLLVYWVGLFFPFVVWRGIVWATGGACGICRDAIITCEVTSLRTAMYKCCRDIFRGDNTNTVE